jgi:FkbM family methyltransferase
VSRETALRVPTVRRRLRLRGGPADAALIAEIARRGGLYERRTMAVLARLLRPDDVTLDVGAHIGAMTLAAAVLAPRGGVHAFEPVRVSAALARENASRNGLGNVHVHRLAVDEREGSARVHLNPAAAGGSFVSERSALGPTETVPATSLDAWVEAAGLERVDLVKVDAEGSELGVLRGARGVLGRFRPAVVVECNPVTLARFRGERPAALLAELRRYGACVDWIGRGGALSSVASEEELGRRLRRFGVGELLASPRRPRRGGPRALAGRASDGLALRRLDRRRPPALEYRVPPAIRLHAVGPVPERLGPGAAGAVAVEVENGGRGWVSSDFREHPVMLAPRWRSADGVSEDARTRLPAPLRPGARLRVEVAVRAPASPGRRRLTVSAVQEGYAWLDALDPGVELDLGDVLVEEPSAA